MHCLPSIVSREGPKENHLCLISRNRSVDSVPNAGVRFAAREEVTKSEEAIMDAAGSCNACGAAGTSLMKLSLGKDFFGRAYDRLSPSTDQSPKWYCEQCSMQKNLQRDFRDIRAEFDKLASGQSSELLTGETFQRAAIRLHEIAAILGTTAEPSPFLAAPDVTQLIARFQTTTMQA
jgi:hypothetical protein